MDNGTISFTGMELKIFLAIRIATLDRNSEINAEGNTEEYMIRNVSEEF